MRYFLISYTAGKNLQAVHGNLTLSYPGFPSNRLLVEYLIPAVAAGKQVLDVSSPVIFSIYEFKCREDFMAFTDESDIPEELIKSIS